MKGKKKKNEEEESGGLLHGPAIGNSIFDGDNVLRKNNLPRQEVKCLSNFGRKKKKRASSYPFPLLLLFFLFLFLFADTDPTPQITLFLTTKLVFSLLISSSCYISFFFFF